MKTFSIRASLLAAFVILVAVSGVGTGYATHSWGGYHWARTSNPFTLKLGNNMTGDWPGYLTKASTDWSADTGSNPLNTVVVGGSTNPKNCRAVAGTVQVCNSTYGNNGWLGLASIWLDSNGHIVQGTTKMNDTYFNTAKYKNANEKLHVVCQEVGHTFGLGHTSEDGSSQNTCMDYFSNTGANATSTLSTQPNAHDYEELATIYAHLDATNSSSAAGPGPRGGFQSFPGKGGPNGVDGNGTPGGASPEHGHWYVENLGNGMQLVTHVFWAEQGR
ncbi:MAG: hypothetical protein ABIP13_05455 [Tepidiformaceae bacterium]